MRRRWDVVVVGGGLAGLAAARALDDLDVRVLEREAAPGGRVMTRVHDGVEYELGAIFPPTPTASDAPSIAIHQGGRLGRGASVPACLDALGIPDAANACAAWARGDVVAPAVRRALDACFHVIHPGPIVAALPERRADALQRFPVTRRPGGNGALVDGLVGPSLVTGVEVTAIDDGPDGVRLAVRGRSALHARAVVCAVPAPTARALGVATPPVDFAPGAVVVVAVDDAMAEPWSYCVTPDHPCSAVVQHVVPARGVRVLHVYYAGALTTPPIEDALAALRDIGATRVTTPVFTDARHWPMLGPIVDERAYGARDPHALQPSPHVVLAGDWTFGDARTDLPYGMAAAILSGRAAARRLRPLLEATTCDRR